MIIYACAIRLSDNPVHEVSDSMKTSNQHSEEMVPLKTDSDGTSSNEARQCAPAIDGLLKFIFAAAIILCVASVIFLGGLLTGRSALCSSDNGVSSTSSAPPNWGAEVTVDGKTVPVVQWLDTELKPENIRENLRLGAIHAKRFGKKCPFNAQFHSC